MGFPLTGVTLSLAIFLVGSAEATLESNPQDCISIADFDEDTDYFPAKFVPHNTTDLFEISYHKTYKVITNKFQDKSYLLYMCGTPPPADEIASGKHHLVLPVPHKGGIAITQTPQIAPPEMLGKRREITAYIGNPKYVSSPCLDYMADVEKSLKIIYFPEDSSNSTLKSNHCAQSTVFFFSSGRSAVKAAALRAEQSYRSSVSATILFANPSRLNKAL